MSSPNYNPIPQTAPGASAAIGHTIENSIPLSIFPITTDKFVFAFCGLPGHGKTHISRRTARYLSFFHAVPVEVFNMTQYRLKMCGAMPDADWFDVGNVEAQKIRESVNNKIIEDVIEFLGKNSVGVAIIDSTNPTHKRRTNLMQKLRVTGAKVMFIEVINSSTISSTPFSASSPRNDCDSCDFEETVKEMPDYADVECEKAAIDYRRRVQAYAAYFEPVSEGVHREEESKWSFFKCDHGKQNFVVNRVSGYLPMKVVHFIMNLRTTSKAFYLTRHGQSEYNVVGRIGGDSSLSIHGLNYAKALAGFVREHITHSSEVRSDGENRIEEKEKEKEKEGKETQEVPVRLWTSTLRRTKETAQFLPQNKLILKDFDGVDYEWVQCRPRAWHHLDELFAGSCDGMTYEEIEEQFPEEFARRNTDKLAYRF